MKKIILIFLITISTLSAWEVTTHRAIDQKALEKVAEQNLKTFVDDAQIGNEDYANEQFEGYTDQEIGGAVTYFNYFNKDKSNDGMAKWGQIFENKYNYQDLIEAGSMLEDAVWSNAWVSWNGRFNNHFYESQNNGKGLTWGYGTRVNMNGGRIL